MIVVGCSHGSHLAKKIADKLKKPYFPLEVTHFPDSEIKLRYKINIKNKDIVLVQSFYGNVNDCIIEALFAAETAADLGAKKITLVAPYFPYLRQDKRFNQGECISLRTIAKNVDEDFDRVIIIDPHLHREKTLKHIFKISSTKLTADHLIADYIKKHIKNALIIGPDVESYKWAEKTAEIIGCESAILKKDRISARKVKVSFNKRIDTKKSKALFVSSKIPKEFFLDIKNKNIVIVDDIISTGHTLLETIKLLKKTGAKKITCICVHGIFAENGLKKLRRTGAKIISCNTIPNPVAKIDVSEIIAKAI